MKIIKSSEWIKELNSNDKVLLVNPPVYEVRYAWARWNQPTDLLLLSSKLKNEVQCQVQLLDFMLPTEAGRVSATEGGKQKEVNGYKKRRYGMSFDEARNNLLKVISEWKPTHIVITSLTSYWYEGILTLMSPLRTILEDCTITVIGAYPILEINHAKRTFANYLINNFFDFNGYIPDFEIYFDPITRTLNSGKVISFAGLIYTQSNAAQNLIKQIESIKKRQIKNYVLFENNLFKEDCTIIDELLIELVNKSLNINLHGLCGIEIKDAKSGIFEKMLGGGFRSFFLEYDLIEGELNLDNYKRMYHELCVNPIKALPSGQLAGFIMIGKPDDNLEKLFKHSLNLLELCGSIIPKPYTANINTKEYEKLTTDSIDFLSPHVFPFAEDAGITRREYAELYQHITFLNEKRMGKSFDFFDNSYCTIALKNSLGKRGI